MAIFSMNEIRTFFHSLHQAYVFRNNQRDENSEFTFFKDTNYLLGNEVVDIPTKMNNMQ